MRWLRRAYPEGARQIVCWLTHVSDDPRYRWLNDVVCVGTGEVRPDQLLIESPKSSGSHRSVSRRLGARLHDLTRRGPAQDGQAGRARRRARSASVPPNATRPAPIRTMGALSEPVLGMSTGGSSPPVTTNDADTAPPVEAVAVTV